MSGIVTELPTDLDSQVQVYMNNLIKFGITHVGHGIILNNLIPTATYSHQEFAWKYRDEQLFEIDPLRRYAIETPFEIIAWENISAQTKEEIYAFEQRKKICSVNKGVLISLKSQHVHETFVFGADYSKFDFYKLCQENLNDILGNMQEISRIHRSAYRLSPVNMRLVLNH